MSDILTAVILGIVEGITEMLPVSSTGHLILVNQWFSFGEPFTTLFDIVIQCGAILAVLTYFWALMSPFQPKGKRSAVFRLWLLLAIGIFPILVLGYLVGGDVLDRLFTVQTVAIALMVGGILLVVIDRFAPPPNTTSLASLTKGQVVFVGLTHILGLIPGMSRSASATIGAMALGIDRTTASQFSMLMAIPTLFVASAYSLLKFEGTITSSQWGLLTVGFFVSWVVCYLTVKWFFRFIQKFGLQYFGYYRIILGVAVLILLR
jgi:undecaprenyl-diphosphatase